MTDLESIEGLFIGQLDERERRTFERAIEDGEAVRPYEGGAGFMGLARVRLTGKSRSTATQIGAPTNHAVHS